jgi:hypothetical protein
MIAYSRGRQPTPRVQNVANWTIFIGTLNELKYSKYDLIYSSIIPIISTIYISILKNKKE